MWEARRRRRMAACGSSQLRRGGRRPPSLLLEQVLLRGTYRSLAGGYEFKRCGVGAGLRIPSIAMVSLSPHLGDLLPSSTLGVGEKHANDVLLVMPETERQWMKGGDAPYRPDCCEVVLAIARGLQKLHVSWSAALAAVEFDRDNALAGTQ
ncbi:hypothetical protein NOVOSPHI9U_110007 [Novosphingobium sp. 9U]|nr:hypothetical protein NOVOSPHI9U_110007 [Novosphingobium sp. 9U]